MYLENLVMDAVEPRRLGLFWEAVVGGERLTDEPDGFETRLTVEGGPVLDLGFQPVPEGPSEPPRLHFDVLGAAHQTEVVDRLLGLGARHLDIAQGDLPGVMLADPEGNPFRVTEERSAYVDTGPIAALSLASADPDSAKEFWSWLAGWTEAPGIGSHCLRHPSMRGPVLELRPQPARKGTAKNRLHLDIRLETGDDPDGVSAGIAERGGREFKPDWGDLPWRHYTDPSGNEFCVLPARA